MRQEGLTRLDHEMIQCAKNRGIVILDNGYTVMLVAWKAGHRPRARITYPSGGSASIPGARIVGTVEDWTIHTSETRSHEQHAV